jgi:protein tyrosine phosphatase
MIHENQMNVVVKVTTEPKPEELKIGKVTHFKNITRSVRKASLITKGLMKTEYELFDTKSPDAQYTQKVVFFEIANFPDDEDSSSEQINDFISAICIMRNQMKAKKNTLKLFAHDNGGGVNGAAVFIALYELLQKVDENVNEHNQPKNLAEKVNIFQVVNKLRTDRVMMVSTFSKYQLLHLCLAEYGKNKDHFDSLKPKKSSLNSARRLEDDAGTVSTRRQVVRRRDREDDIFDTYSEDEDDSEYLIE